jgi:hypothetical protein
LLLRSPHWQRRSAQQKNMSVCGTPQTLNWLRYESVTPLLALALR